MDIQPFAPFSLRNKTAVVVGGMHGIGLALSKYLADAGAHVAIVDAVDDETLHEALEEINTPKHMIIGYQDALDTVKDLQIVAKKMIPQMGEFDIWVNSEAKDLYKQPAFIKALIPYMHDEGVIMNFVHKNPMQEIPSLSPQLKELAELHHIGLYNLPLPSKGH